MCLPNTLSQPSLPLPPPDKVCTRSSLGEAAARAVTRAATGLEALLVSIDNNPNPNPDPNPYSAYKVTS